MSLRRFCFFVAMATCFLFPSSLAVTSAASVSNDDKIFLQEALNSAAWLGALGDLARRQAASDGVRRFGENLASRCGSQRAQIERLAQEHALSVEVQISNAGQSTLNYFSLRQGADFDRNFVSLLMDESRRLADEYQRQAHSGSARTISVFAETEAQFFEKLAMEAGRLMSELPKPVLK